MSYIRLIFVALVSLFITSCGSNQNDLAIPGRNCSSKLDVGSLVLDEKSKENQKVGQKLTHKTLPDGEYNMTGAEVFVAELTDGSSENKMGFKAYYQISLVSEEEQIQLQEEVAPGEKVSEQDLYTNKEKCLSNVPRSALNYSVEGITAFSKAGEDFTNLETKNFDMKYDIGPDDKFIFSFASTDTNPANPDDFYKGGNRDQVDFEAALFSLTEKNVKGRDIYQSRQQVIVDDRLIRLVVFYDKL